MKKFLLLMAFLSITSTCQAGTLHDLQDNIGEDKFAHAGVSYIVCDQLHRNAGFNDFWAAFTTLALGYAKEKLIDKDYDGGDMMANGIGVLMYQIKF